MAKVFLLTPYFKNNVVNASHPTLYEGQPNTGFGGALYADFMGKLVVSEAHFISNSLFTDEKQSSVRVNNNNAGEIETSRDAMRRKSNRAKDTDPLEKPGLCGGGLAVTELVSVQVTHSPPQPITHPCSHLARTTSSAPPLSTPSTHPFLIPPPLPHPALDSSSLTCTTNQAGQNSVQVMSQ